MVVQAALRRTELTDNKPLGLAIKKLYDESLTDEYLAALLDAVLAKNTSEKQFQQFQTFVRTARNNPELLNDDKPLFSVMAREEREKEDREMAAASAMILGTTETELSSGANGTPRTNGEMVETVQGKTTAAGEDSESDLTSVASGEDSAKTVPSVGTLTTQRHPSYEELKKDSDIRHRVQVLESRRTRTRKRGRSPSPDRASNAPRPGVAEEVRVKKQPSSTPVPETQTTTPPVQHPKKKSKTTKTKVS
jgi:hypothetical protein